MESKDIPILKINGEEGYDKFGKVYLGFLASNYAFWGELSKPSKLKNFELLLGRRLTGLFKAIRDGDNVESHVGTLNRLDLDDLELMPRIHSGLNYEPIPRLIEVEDTYGLLRGSCKIARDSYADLGEIINLGLQNYAHKELTERRNKPINRRLLPLCLRQAVYIELGK